VPLHGSPQRIFVSVDETTRRSNISFLPSDVGGPITFDEDAKGEQAVTRAKEIAGDHRGCTIDGPHFHSSNPGKQRRPRRPPRS
jgi:hypothetical protein